MDVDAGLGIVGLTSRVQVVNLALFAVCISLASLQSTGVAFTVDHALEHRCAPPPGFAANETTPLVDRDGRWVADGCHMYAVRNGTLTGNLTTCEHGWEYPGARSGETNTLSDFNLVCDRGILAGTLISITYTGALVGCYLMGQASDIVGRRPVTLCCLALISVIGTAISFTWNLQLMMALRFLLGVLLPGCSLVTYVRSVEMFTPKSRTIGNAIVQTFWGLGVLMVAPIAYLLPNWRHFQLAISLSCLPVLALHWFFSYESLRWLVQAGRAQQAEGILKKIAKSKNIEYEGSFLLPQREDDAPRESSAPPEGGPAPEKPTDDAPATRDEAATERSPAGVSGEANGYLALLPPGDRSPDKPGDGDGKDALNINAKEPAGKKYTVLDLFKTRGFIKHTCIFWYLWFAVDTMYFGLIVYTTSLTGNKYLNFFLLALVEVVAYIHDYVIARRFGRRRPIAAFFLASAASCTLLAFLPEETADGTNLTVLIVVVAMVGKFYSSASFDVTMFIGAEIFPTVLRNIAEGSAATVGGVGGVISPFIVHLGSKVRFLPMTIFAAMSLVACACVILLPETKGRPLPETYEDGAKLTRVSEGAR